MKKYVATGGNASLQTPKTSDVQLEIIEELGYKLAPQSVVLDFGCGAGELVKEYLDKGFQAFGCDIVAYGDDTESLMEKGVVRLIESDPYRIPFDDDTFDLTVSTQVFEHVMDYESAVSEIKRVLKPGGINLHIIPSRHVVIEGHVHVPFTTMIRGYWWLLLWAYLGIRNEFQKGKPPAEVAKINHGYLLNHTNYLTRGQIQRQIGKHFNNVVFCCLYARGGRGARLIRRYSKVIPFLPFLIDTCRSIKLTFRGTQYWRGAQYWVFF